MFKAYKYYWQNAFKYKARSTRADYWWPVLINVIIFAILITITLLSIGNSAYDLALTYSNYRLFPMSFMVITIVFGIANIFPSISISVRRFRDAGISGWAILAFWLVSLILTSGNSSVLQATAFAVDIIELVVYCLPTDYINKHGWWSPNYNDDVGVPSLQNTNKE